MAAVLAALLGGCAYYNGMWNAKHFASQAEQSERKGRISEAAERWRIAAIHAESVTTRHPRSHWVDEALLLRAKALIHLESWSTASIVAEQALRASRNDESRREAWLYIGLADVGMRQADPATAALDSAALTRDPKRRSEAWLARGRVLLASGRPMEALADLRRSNAPEARFDRARAALADGDVALAAATADTVTGEKLFAEELWLPFLDSLAPRDADAARRLTDALVARNDVRNAPKARLLIAEGDRALAARQDSAAAARYQAARALVPDSVEAREATLRLTRMDLAVAPTAADLLPLGRRLATIAAAGGAPAPEANDLVRLMVAADSLAQRPGPADAWWFLRAELLRDSLGARAAAGDEFAQMAARFPDSPWTPKGLLAAIALHHPAADSLQALLASRYGDNPYTIAAAGGLAQADRFAVLEDSLQTIIASAQASLRPGQNQAPPAVDDEPGLRNRPAVPRPATPPGRPTTRPTIEP